MEKSAESTKEKKTQLSITPEEQEDKSDLPFTLRKPFINEKPYIIKPYILYVFLYFVGNSPLTNFYVTKSQIFGRRKLYGIHDCYTTMHEDLFENAQCVQ